MSGREVREYTNLTDPKDKKLGKGKDRIDDEETTFQRMVSKWDLGFIHRVLDVYRCKMLLENVEVTFMDEALWTVMIYSISKSKWKLRKMQSVSYAAVAETSPALVPLPLRVELKPKSGIRQQVFLKRVVEVKPKRRNVSSPSHVDQSSLELSGQPSKKHHSVSSNHEVEKAVSSTTFSKVGEETKSDNAVKSLLAAYGSSDDED
ncbi:hypothetical protein OROHE_016313 [Orobanche hederae]